MFADEERPPTSGDGGSREGSLPIALPLFAVQLQNIIPLEVVARRFPSVISGVPTSLSGQGSQPQVQLNIEEPSIEAEKLQAQVAMDVHVSSTDLSFSFEISLKLLGFFTFAADYDVEFVRTFLRQGTLSVMLPVARDLLMNLCAQLQVPLIVLPLVQLAPPPVPDAGTEQATQ
jgi:preprotein translocase subunit SecB